jgi:hypothetical protein
MRYRIEQLFGSIKQKIGSSFKLLKEDLSRKASVALEQPPCLKLIKSADLSFKVL